MKRTNREIVRGLVATWTLFCIPFVAFGDDASPKVLKEIPVVVEGNGSSDAIKYNIWTCLACSSEENVAFKNAMSAAKFKGDELCRIKQEDLTGQTINPWEKFQNPQVQEKKCEKHEGSNSIMGLPVDHFYWYECTVKVSAVCKIPAPDPKYQWGMRPAPAERGLSTGESGLLKHLSEVKPEAVFPQ